jgi:hypothetical protein
MWRLVRVEKSAMKLSESAARGSLRRGAGAFANSGRRGKVEPISVY